MDCMRISDLIAKLEAIRNKCGDTTVHYIFGGNYAVPISYVYYATNDNVVILSTKDMK